MQFSVQSTSDFEHGHQGTEIAFLGFPQYMYVYVTSLGRVLIRLS